MEPGALQLATPDPRFMFVLVLFLVAASTAAMRSSRSGSLFMTANFALAMAVGGVVGGTAIAL